MANRKLTMFLALMLCCTFLLGLAPARAENVHLMVWGAIAGEKGPFELIEAFEAKNPGITVEYVQFRNNADGNTKLNTALIDGADVDVFVNYGVANLDARWRDLCEPLDAYMQQDGFVMDEHFSDGYATFENGVYGLPASTIKDLVYLNMAALEEAGLPLPAANWTIEDLEKYAAALTKGEGVEKRFGSVAGILGKEWAWYVQGVLGANCYYKADGTSNFDDPLFAKALSFVLKLENELKVQYSRTELIASKLDYITEFDVGNSAMLFASDAIIRNFLTQETYPRDWKIGFANFPALSADQEQNYKIGRSYFDYVSVAKNSRNKEAAWKLCRFWATEGSEYLFKYGRFPAWKQMDIESAIDMMFTDDIKPYFDLDSFKSVVLDFDSPGVVDDHFVAYSDIENTLITEAEKAWVGMQTVEESLANAKKLADQAIAEAQK